MGDDQSIVNIEKNTIKKIVCGMENERDRERNRERGGEREKEEKNTHNASIICKFLYLTLIDSK